MLGLYIHIPFCRKICSYCDFYKMVVSDELKSKFFDYLIKDFNLLDDGVSNVNTIYIGGGTPSSVKLELLERLFIELKKRINLDKIIEFTTALVVKNDYNSFEKHHIVAKRDPRAWFPFINIYNIFKYIFY